MSSPVRIALVTFLMLLLVGGVAAIDVEPRPPKPKQEVAPEPGDEWARLVFTIPYINNFLLVPEDESGTKIGFGFFGIGTGVEILHSGNQFLALTASAAVNFPVPVPVSVEHSVGERERFRSIHVTFSNNHVFGNKTLGYGFAFARNWWELDYEVGLDQPRPSGYPVEKVSSSLGFVIPATIMLSKSWSVGFTYRPTVFRFDADPDVKLEHLVSVDISYRIRL